MPGPSKSPKSTVCGFRPENTQEMKGSYGTSSFSDASLIAMSMSDLVHPTIFKSLAKSRTA
eukprot:CAMPEP_0180652124 /NCGR_PEP_ID=MMETSP1037_2-20121125/53297_1 /TAXON_ID=632150 /ORGANISM="Azadinium spinosum, Strain 3D9" /LENGTH=60 /DNA_ID=CAMNT_0022677911 /DNA_START=29 /DNA_END=207 /DNA_ORIENTATION=-